MTVLLKPDSGPHSLSVAEARALLAAGAAAGAPKDPTRVAA